MLLQYRQPKQNHHRAASAANAMDVAAVVAEAVGGVTVTRNEKPLPVVPKRVIPVVPKRVMIVPSKHKHRLLMHSALRAPRANRAREEKRAASEVMLSARHVSAKNAKPQ